MAETTTVIETRGLSRRYGEFTAVHPLDLQIARGTIFGFVGANGAGKTTTISMLTGLLEPSGGSVLICGERLTSNAVDVKRRIGYVADQPALFEYLRPAEYLTLVGRTHGLTGADLAHRVGELIDVLDLSEVQNRIASQCSHGTRKRLAFAAAVIHEPDVLFLDEPFEGMDAMTARVVVRNLTLMGSRGTTIFLTSHILDVVERTCDRIVIFNAGQVVWDSPASDIRARVFERMEDQRASALERVLVELTGTSSADSVFSWLRDAKGGRS